MRFYLRRVGVPFDAHLLNELPGNRDPVLLWEGHLVSVHVTRRAIKLAFGHDFLQVLDLELESECVVSDLFSHCRWRCALTVSSAKHRHVGQLLS